MRKSILLSACLFALGLTSLRAGAAVVLNDNFDSYTNGTLSGQGGWTATAAAATPMQVAGASDKFVQINSSGQDEYHALSQAIPHADGSFVETSFTFNLSAAQAAGDYFSHLSDPVGTASFFYQRIFAKSTTGGYLIGLLPTAGGTPVTVYGTTVLAFNTEHTLDVVWNFVPGPLNDTFTLSVDGSAYLSDTWDSTSAEPAQISSANLRQGSAASAPTVQFDDYVVQGAVPEPASASLFLGAAGLVLGRRSRRK